MSDNGKTTFINNVGFRKNLMKWTSLGATIAIGICVALMIANYVIHVIMSPDPSFQPKNVVTPEMLYALLGLTGIATASYATARMGPGSPEYTPPDLRHLDPTINKPVVAEVAQTSGAGMPPPPAENS